MSKRNIPNVDWANQLENAICQFVKEKLYTCSLKS